MTSRIPVSISFNGITNFLGVIGVIGSLIFCWARIKTDPKDSIRQSDTAERKYASRFLPR